MALPTNMSTVTVRGRVLESLDGDPAKGHITFTNPYLLLNMAELAYMIPDSKRADLDENGEFEIELPATDDPDVLPVGWVYRVNENWSSGRAGLLLALPAAVPEVDWVTIAPDLVTGIWVGTDFDDIVGPPGPIGPPGPPGSLAGAIMEAAIDPDTDEAYVEITSSPWGIDDLGAAFYDEAGAAAPFRAVPYINMDGSVSLVTLNRDGVA